MQTSQANFLQKKIMQISILYIIMEATGMHGTRSGYAESRVITRVQKPHAHAM